ncbi:hypothetical protein ACTHQY_15085 [Rhodococcoides corynebacterioides]|uniref:hypothetical protein n=1 Tax=Rhodococcoides corynebacterioides TaxID=53972 RepID=UPI003F7ECC89
MTTVPGTELSSYDDALTLVYDTVRAAGAASVDFTSKASPNLLLPLCLQVPMPQLWSATAEFPDGHTIVGVASMPTTLFPYAAVLSACCDLLRHMGCAATADRITGAEFTRGGRRGW